jgi:uncharacterized protein YbcI
MSTLRAAAQQALEALEQFAGTKLVRTSGVINDLRTALAEPERKPLTDEEIVDLWADVSIDYDDQINIIEMARAIERAHGIGGEA